MSENAAWAWSSHTAIGYNLKLLQLGLPPSLAANPCSSQPSMPGMLISQHMLLPPTHGCCMAKRQALMLNVEPDHRYAQASSFLLPRAAAWRGAPAALSWSGLVDLRLLLLLHTLVTLLLVVLDVVPRQRDRECPNFAVRCMLALPLPKPLRPRQRNHWWWADCSWSFSCSIVKEGWVRRD